MRVAALNRIFGTLAVSPNATMSVFGKDGSKDDVVALKNPPGARPACNNSPIRPAVDREDMRDAKAAAI